MQHQPITPLDPDETTSSRENQMDPGVHPEEIAAVKNAVSNLRLRVATEGLHFRGQENMETLLWLQWIEGGLEKLMRDVHAERASRNENFLLTALETESLQPIPKDRLLCAGFPPPFPPFTPAWPHRDTRESASF